MADVNLAKALAANVRREMLVRGMTQKQLASKAGVSQPHISELLSGKHSGSLGTVEKIARAFGISPYALLAPPVEAVF